MVPLLLAWLKQVSNLAIFGCHRPSAHFRIDRDFRIAVPHPGETKSPTCHDYSSLLMRSLLCLGLKCYRRANLRAASSFLRGNCESSSRTICNYTINRKIHRYLCTYGYFRPCSFQSVLHASPVLYRISHFEKGRAQRVLFN